VHWKSISRLQRRQDAFRVDGEHRAVEFQVFQQFQSRQHLHLEGRVDGHEARLFAFGGVSERDGGGLGIEGRDTVRLAIGVIHHLDVTHLSPDEAAEQIAKNATQSCCTAPKYWSS